jgi:hypothetical protein
MVFRQFNKHRASRNQSRLGRTTLQAIKLIDAHKLVGFPVPGQEGETSLIRGEGLDAKIDKILT